MTGFQSFSIGLLLASTESEECHQPHADQDQAGGLGNEDGRNFDAVNPSTRRIARGRLTASREAFTTDTGEHKDFAFATEDEVSVKRGNVDVADRLVADRVVPPPPFTDQSWQAGSRIFPIANRLVAVAQLVRLPPWALHSKKTY